MQYYNLDYPVNSPEIISRRIDNIRRDLGMTQKQFAAALEISQSAVSKYLSGRMPPADVMLKIARLGYTNVEWILTGKQPPLILDGETFVREDKVVYGESGAFFSAYNELPAAVRTAIAALMNYFRNQRR